VLGGVLAATVAGIVMFVIPRSAYVTRQKEARAQPVPFYHLHHVGGMGIDCRYCHTAVDKSATAGIPPTKTCMNCHSQIFNQSPTLEPVRASWKTGAPSSGWKVHDLPDFVYFNHSAHVNKGVGCTTCHGPVDKMSYVWQEKSLLMEWCLDCHRQPRGTSAPGARSTASRGSRRPTSSSWTEARGGIQGPGPGHLLHLPPMSQEHVPPSPGAPGRPPEARSPGPPPLLEEPRRARRRARVPRVPATASSRSRPRCSRTRRAAASS